MSDLEARARAQLAAAEREEWLSVKQFAALAQMTEAAVRLAIREERLGFRWFRLTSGPRGQIRIVVPREAA